MKIFLFAALAVILLYASSVTAQDTTLKATTVTVDTVKQQIVAVDSTTITNPLPLVVFGWNVPGWLQTFAIAFLTLVPFVQFVLKRIPTAYSVKITGILGKILDLLTFFQKDKSANGGTHV